MPSPPALSSPAHGGSQATRADRVLAKPIPSANTWTLIVLPAFWPATLMYRPAGLRWPPLPPEHSACYERGETATDAEKRGLVRLLVRIS